METTLIIPVDALKRKRVTNGVLAVACFGDRYIQEMGHLSEDDYAIMDHDIRILPEVTEFFLLFFSPTQTTRERVLHKSSQIQINIYGPQKFQTVSKL